MEKKVCVYVVHGDDHHKVVLLSTGLWSSNWFDDGLLLCLR